MMYSLDIEEQDKKPTTLVICFVLHSQFDFSILENLCCFRDWTWEMRAAA